MDLKEIHKVVASLQVQLFKNSNSFSVGMLKSHFKGAGLQFKEHQVYNTGDDVRFIDWKLSAKTNNTFIKTFEEERNIEIIVFLDVSNSMLLGFNNVSKLQASLEIICLLYLLAEKSKDLIKVIICSNEIQVLPALSGEQGLALFISRMQKLELLDPKGKVNLMWRSSNMSDEKKKIALIKSYIAKNKEVVLLSDLSKFSDDLVLNQLTMRRNMHTFQILSPVDYRDKLKFSIYTEGLKSSRLAGEKKVMATKLKGKFKVLSLEERYLEEFVREML